MRFLTKHALALSVFSVALSLFSLCFSLACLNTTSEDGGFDVGAVHEDAGSEDAGFEDVDSEDAGKTKREDAGIDAGHSATDGGRDRTDAGAVDSGIAGKDSGVGVPTEDAGEDVDAGQEDQDAGPLELLPETIATVATTASAATLAAPWLPGFTGVLAVCVYSATQAQFGVTVSGGGQWSGDTTWWIQGDEVAAALYTTAPGGTEAGPITITVDGGVDSLAAAAVEFGGVASLGGYANGSAEYQDATVGVTVTGSEALVVGAFCTGGPGIGAWNSPDLIGSAGLDGGADLGVAEFGPWPAGTWWLGVETDTKTGAWAATGISLGGQ